MFFEFINGEPMQTGVSVSVCIQIVTSRSVDASTQSRLSNDDFFARCFMIWRRMKAICGMEFPIGAKKSSYSILAAV